jgi:hypothetical protein
MQQKKPLDERLFLRHTFAMADSVHAVIFDLDGTLVDTSSEMSAALDATFTELGAARLTHKEV